MTKGRSYPVHFTSLSAGRARKVAAGTFDINLPLTGTTGVECRTGDANGNHTIVFTFSNPLTSVGGAAVTADTGSVSSGAIGSDAHQYVVNLTGVTDGQNVTITITNLTDSLGNTGSSAGVAAGFLIGDANGDRVDNSGDAIFTRNRSGQNTDAPNCRADFNLDGAVNSGDAITVRSRSGNSLP